MRLLSIVLGVIGAALPAAAADWPAWLGPTRNGHTAETSGWANGRWFVEAPAWTARVGEGCTSPLIVKGELFTLGWSGGQDHVFCLNAADGTVKWKQSYASPQYGRHHLGDEDAYSGPTATPEFDADTGVLYTLGIDGELAAWDTRAAGQRVWHVNLYDTYRMPRRPEVGKRGSRRDYGYITAPLVHGDWLIVAAGAPDGHLVAFDKKDGTPRWKSACTEPAGHCGGLAPLSVKGVPCVASLTLRRLVIIRLDGMHAGKTLAEFPWETDFGNNVATPAVQGDEVLITSKYNHEAMCKLRVTARGVEKVWEAPYASGACTPVIAAGHVYWASEKMRCLDFATGKLLWEGGSFGSPGSCIAAADGKLIVWGDRGKLALIAPAAESPDKYQELARVNRVCPAASWPHIALADGRLYCKDRDGNLVCFAQKNTPRE